MTQHCIIEQACNRVQRDINRRLDQALDRGIDHAMFGVLCCVALGCMMLWWH